MKKEKKKQAVSLREKGYSLNEISHILGISKGSASLWLRSTPLDSIASSRIYQRVESGRVHAILTRRRKKESFLQNIYIESNKEVSSIQYSRKLNRLLCALLYWCEGAKTGYSARFINSDPTLVSTFLKLFRSSFAVDEKKFKACLHLHNYHNEEKQKKFWSHVTGIPLSQFLKTYQKAHTGKRKKVDYPGCISIRYNDGKMLSEIEAIWKSFRDNIGGVV